jgi:nuclear pore complex protein Nup62
LNDSITKVEETQGQIDQTLDYIDSQQSELTAALDSYETQIRSLIEGGGLVSAAPGSSGPVGAGSIGGAGVMGSSVGAGAVGGSKVGVRGMPVRLTPADEEREKAYTLAENLNRQVDDMGRQLTHIIEEINAAKVSREGVDEGVSLADGPVVNNPFGKIVKILDAHLSSLQWLDESAEEMELKALEVCFFLHL